MHQRRAAAHEFEKVAPLDGRETRMPVVRHPRAGSDCDWLRSEMKIQRLSQAERIPVAFQIAMRDLTDRVNPCIGAPGGGDLVAT